MPGTKFFTPNAVVDHTFDSTKTSTTDMCTVTSIMPVDLGPSDDGLSLTCPTLLPSITTLLTPSDPQEDPAIRPDSATSIDRDTSAPPLPALRQGKGHSDNDNNDKLLAATETADMRTLRAALRDANQLNEQYMTITAGLHATCEALTQRIWAFEGRVVGVEGGRAGKKGAGGHFPRSSTAEHGNEKLREEIGGWLRGGERR